MCVCVCVCVCTTGLRIMPIPDLWYNIAQENVCNLLHTLHLAGLVAENHGAMNMIDINMHSTHWRFDLVGYLHQYSDLFLN